MLVNQPVNVCALILDQAKKLSKHFGYFQNQIKEMPTEEAEVYKNVPMRHIVGDHDGCGDWCAAKKAKAKNRKYTKKPMFNLAILHNKKTWEQVKEVHQKATTKERRAEMEHKITTQPNDSLNMRAAELAPTYKNYSRTYSLDCRISMAFGHHNVGYSSFYSSVFCDLDISLENQLKNWLQMKDDEMGKKKGQDKSRDQKMKRAYKFQAKLAEELYHENTKPIKMGTYKSDVALESSEEDEIEEKRSRKPRDLCPYEAKVKHMNRNHKSCLFNPKNTTEEMRKIEDESSTYKLLISLI